MAIRRVSEIHNRALEIAKETMPHDKCMVKSSKYKGKLAIELLGADEPERLGGTVIAESLVGQIPVKEAPRVPKIDARIYFSRESKIGGIKAFIVGGVSMGEKGPLWVKAIKEKLKKEKIPVEDFR